MCHQPSSPFVGSPPKFPANTDPNHNITSTTAPGRVLSVCITRADAAAANLKDPAAAYARGRTDLDQRLSKLKAENAPRDEVELDVIEGLVRASHAFARAA